VKHGLPPIAWPSATILILGSLPGDESLRKQQYYGNPRNQFWDVLGRVFGEPVGAEYAEKIAWLERRGIALWDVLAAAERRGSLDSDIRNEQANDFARLFRRLPRLETIALNGSKAALSFERYVRPALPQRLAAVREKAAKEERERYRYRLVVGDKPAADNARPDKPVPDTTRSIPR